MIITAKFASVCPCCSNRIAIGSKVEWERGAKAKHAACAGATGPSVASASPSAIPYVASRRKAVSGGRGRWNGCSCGAREMADGSLSSNACAFCRYDNE